MRGYEYPETYLVTKGCYAYKYHETQAAKYDIKEKKSVLGFTTLAPHVVYVEEFINYINQEFGTEIDPQKYESIFQALNYGAEDTPSSEPDRFLEGSTLDQTIQVPVTSRMNLFLRNHRNTFNKRCHVNIVMKYYGAPQVCIETIVVQSERGGSAINLIHNSPKIWYTMKTKKNGAYTGRVKKAKTEILDCQPERKPYSLSWFQLPRVKKNSHVKLKYVDHENLTGTDEDDDNAYTGTKRSRKRKSSAVKASPFAFLPLLLGIYHFVL